MENNLTAGAFTPNQLELLKVISSQAAIAIANAQLYATLQDYNRTLEAQVTECAQALEAKNQELQKAELSARESRAKFFGILQIAEDAIISVNLDQCIQLFNQGAEKIFGYQAAEVLGQSLDILLPESFRQIHRQHIRDFGNSKTVARAMNKTKRGIIRGRRKNGEEFPAEASISKLELNDGLLFTVILNDITRRLQAEQAVQQKNKELATTLQQLKTTQDELIQSEKMAALGQLVAGVAHEINTPLGAIRSSIGNIAGFLTNNLNQLPQFFQELPPERQQDFFTLLQKATSQNNSLSTKEKRQLKRDVQRQLESLGIENADSLASTLVNIGIWGEIDAILPLLKAPDCNHILNMAYELASVIKSSRTITTATERAAKIVFALKSYARYDHSGEKVQANIIEGIETVLTLYQNQLKQGVEVIRNYGECPAISCYPDELNQVWTNLIHNALQAMEYHGILKIEVTCQQHNMLVKITDNGKGIPPEVMPRIFEPFFTTKRPGEGSGLGLDIVKMIIEKHQGKIEVFSVAGKTTFSVLLPI
ncbi:MAG TPA: hypothetical protein DDZ80_16565 [Cyanobacteria bacterium UBA8803]|nr:hypothetical protein [Cyanobacteria bacterium UBA9273]HBL60022.1 hypothetical protein [Cyanobacteria bacterium UBA8803]